MPSYCLYLFGAPRIERDLQPFTIPRRKGTALLAYLAVTAQAHSRESLATMFWPEFDQSAALANLRRDLSALKGALGDELLLIERQNISLNPASDMWLDVAEFGSRVTKARSHEHPAPLCPECLAALSEAAALYTGDFMAGFNLPDSPQFDEWQFFQSDGLRQALAESLQKLIEVHSGSGAYEPAIEFARRWLLLDALHEPAHRQLMKLYALAGQQSAALRQYQECARILEEELGLSPEEETRQLYEAIRAKQFPLQQKERPARHNLPAQTTAFIGRQKELRELQRLLVEEPENRLTTILGPGGTGKTRLAIEAARSVAGRFSHGVCFVPLAAIRSAKNIPSVLADSMGLHHYEGDHPQQLFDYLREKQMLLVLDNFEHLLDGADLLGEILERTPEVKILVTSRQRLDLSSENLYVLAGMEYPEGHEAEQGLEYDAMALLLQCIRRVHPDFEPQPRDLQAMIRICQLVQGMPLALVLAAGWVEVLTLDEIASEIPRCLDILETEMRDLPERQRSVRAVFDYSWNLLAEEQRQTLLKCCLFQGGFTRHAAQAVAGASIKTLLALINKSWLQRDEQGRYQIHELTRQYAQEKLGLDPAAYFEARANHSAYFAGLLNDLQNKMKGPQQKEAFSTVAIEFENIRTAWHWFAEQDQLETAVQSILPALFRYCEARARSFELIQLIRAARTSVEDHSAAIGSRAYAIMLTAQAAFFRNGFPVRFEIFGMFIPAEEQALSRAWSMAGRPEDLQAMGFWGILLAYLYGRISDVDEGIQYSRELVHHLRQRNISWELAFSLELLLQLLEMRFKAGIDADEIERNAIEALEIFRTLGDERESGFTLRLFGQLRRLQHNYPEAIQHWQTAQEKLQAVGDWATAADIHWQLGDIYLQMGEFGTAFRHYQAMNQAYEEKGATRAAAHMLSKESYEALRYSDIDHAWRTRQRSLAFAREVGDIFSESWSLWELGEIYRVMGEHDKARSCYEDHKALLDRFEDPNGITFYHRGLGDLALARNDLVEAERQFGESLKYALAAGHSWAMSYALTGLGRASSSSGNYARSRDYFTQALKRAKEADELGIALVALAGVAELYTATGGAERARDLATLVVNHHVSWRETKDQGRAILAGITGSLPVEAQVEFGEQAGRLDVWEKVDKLINGLGIST